jgi:glyoxylate reductase
MMSPASAFLPNATLPAAGARPYTPASEAPAEKSMQIVITRPVDPYLIKMLQDAGHEVTTPKEDTTDATAALLASRRDVQGVITFPTDRVDAAFLDSRPNLRAVSNFAVGFNNIDVPACTQRRIGASNTPGVLNDATAEVAWLLLMMTGRRAGEGERAVRANKWTGWAPQGPQSFTGMDIVGKTLGVIGAGRIGSRFAMMAEGFDMPLLYHNRHTSREMEALGAQLVSLDELLQRSDFVSVHVPLNEQTRHLIGKRELELMKPTAVLINTARGPVVDEAALVEALKTNKIFGAGLDVYEEEPKVHPGLFELENVVLLPHIGSATVSTRRKMCDLAGKNLIAMLAGKRPLHPLNAELWPQ